MTGSFAASAGRMADEANVAPSKCVLSLLCLFGLGNTSGPGALTRLMYVSLSP